MCVSGERLDGIQKVIGSIPTVATKKRVASESHSKGQSGNRLRCSPLGLRRFPYFKRFLADFHAFPEWFQESLVL